MSSNSQVWIIRNKVTKELWSYKRDWSVVVNSWTTEKNARTQFTRVRGYTKESNWASQTEYELVDVMFTLSVLEETIDMYKDLQE